MYKSKDEFISALRKYYDGYRFSPRYVTRVYNPVSIGSYFSDFGSSFSNYWMNTGGMSTHAVMLARHNNLLCLVEEKVEVNIQDLEVFDVSTLVAESLPRRSALALLYYSGYLTISDTDGSDLYLNFLNEEVRKTFLSSLIETYGNYDRNPMSIANTARKAVLKGDVDGLVKVLNEYYRSFHSTELKQLKERGIQVIFKALFVIAGVKVMAEVPSGLGRLDAMIITENHDYIIEFKADSESSAKALFQIADRHYAWILERERTNRCIL